MRSFACNQKCSSSSWIASAPKLAATPALFTARRRVALVARNDASASTKPTLAIKMPYRVNFGETLRMVGSSPLLGEWNADQGLQLEWSEGDVWVANVPIDAGHYEFKCVVYNVQTNQVSRWEDGGNRVLNITQEPGAWAVDCLWGATTDMTQAFVPAPPPPAPEPVAEATSLAATDTAPEASTSNGGAAEEELLPTFLALEEAGAAKVAEEQAAADVAAVAAAEAAAATAAASTSGAADDTASGSSAGPIALLLATAAAGAAAAWVLLTPGGLDTSVLGSGATAALGGASEAVNKTLLQSSLAGAQVASLQPLVQEQVSSLSDGVAAAATGAAASLGSLSATSVAVVQSTAEGVGGAVNGALGGLAASMDGLQAVAAEAAEQVARQG